MIRVLRYLGASQAPCHLRQLVSDCELSPGGVSDILRRLFSLGVLKRERAGNKLLYSLSITDREKILLENLLLSLQSSALEERAKSFSKNALSKFEWMDEAYTFFREVKRHGTKPAKRS